LLKRLSLAVIVVGLMHGASATSRAQGPELILHCGKIVTVDDQFTIVSAVAVKGGRIAAVGNDDTILNLAGPDTRKIDLAGKTVIPGLIDNHFHYLRAASTWKHEARIDGITSRQKALDAIAAKAQSVPPGTWVFVLGGWSEQQFADTPGGFTAEELDRAAPQNPVFVQKSYSDAYMNRLAAEQIGSTGGGRRGGPAQGGRTPGGGPGRGGPGTGGGRNRGGGARATIGAAMRNMPESSEQERMDEIRQFNAALNRMGLTTVYDIGRENDGDFEPIEALVNNNDLSVRVFHTLRYSAETPLEANRAAERIRAGKPFQSNDWMGLIGIGEHTYGPLHDSAISSSAFSDDDYEQFAKIAAAAAEAGWPIHEHAMQDATIRRMLDVFERIDATYPLARLRWTLAHCDQISPESLARAKKLGVTVAVHDKSAKPVSAGGDSPPMRAIEESGIVWGLGSDASIVSPMSPFYSLWWMASGKVFPDRVSIRSPVSREAALTAHTRSNAWLLFKERDLGSLEPGKLADLVVLDRDYLTVPVDELRDLKPVLTVVGGRVVYEAK
jgi:predicted amidohydrolase YtcJ